MKRSITRTGVLVAAAVGALALAGWQILDGGEPGASGDPGAEGGIRLPRLTGASASGKTAFEANCASCHGRNAVGTNQGPPLLHEIYNPGHHSDQAFLRAVRLGSPQHHWKFGNMPPQPQISDRQLQEIVAYVRALQEANGIVAKPHRM